MPIGSVRWLTATTPCDPMPGAMGGGCRRLSSIDNSGSSTGLSAQHPGSTSSSIGAPLRFGDEVDVELRVAALGETSITYQVAVDRGDESIAAGRMVAVLIDRASGAKKPWPDDMRRALSPPEA